MPAVVFTHQFPRWTRRNLFWGLAIFLNLLLLIPPAWESQAYPLFVLVTFLFGMAAWLTDAYNTDDFAPVPFGPVLLLLLATQVMAVMASQDPAASFNHLAVNLAYFLLFILAYLTSRSQRAVRPALLIFWAIGWLLAGYAVYQHLTGLEQTYNQVFAQLPQDAAGQAIASRLLSKRAFALFVYPNVLAAYLAMLLPIGLSLYFTTRTWFGQIGHSVGILVICAGLLATQSFGGWLLTTLGVAVFWYSRPAATPAARKLNRIGLAVLLLVAAAGMLGLIMLRTPQNLWQDLATRLVNWGSAWHMAWHHLPTGVGPGLFGTFFPEYQAENGDYVRYAHNYLLNYFAEYGLISLAALLAFFVVVARQLGSGWLRLKDHPGYLIFLGLTVSVSIGFLHSLIDVDFNFLKTSAMFWLWLGAALGFSQDQLKKNKRVPQLPVMDKWIGWGLGALGLLGLWRGGKSLLLESLLLGGTSLLLLALLIEKLRGFTSWDQWTRLIPLRWPLGMLLVWGIFAALVSPHPAGGVAGFVLLLVGLSAYVITVLLPKSQGFLMNILGLGASLVGLIVVTSAALQPHVRISVGWPNPNLLAGFLAMGLLSQAVYLLKTKITGLERLVRGSSLVIIFIALLATGSMAGMFNIICGGGVLLALVIRRNPGKWPWVLAAAGLILALAVALPLPLGNRLADLSGYRGQAYERLGMAKAAVSMTLARPMTGFGPGNFAPAFERFSFPNVRGLARFGKTAEFAHNEVLQLAAVAGIPALLLLAWLVAILIGYFRREWRWLKNREQAWDDRDTVLRVSASVALAGAAGQALVDFNWHLPALFIWGMILLGIAVSPHLPFPAGKSRQRAAKPAPGFQPWLMLMRHATSLLLCLLILTAVAAALRPTLSRMLARQGEAYRYKQDLKAASRVFESALVVYPLASEVYDQLGQVRLDFYALMGTDNWYQLSEWSFKKALSLDSLDAYIHRHLGMLYFQKAGHMNLQEQVQYSVLAEQQYRLAIEKSPHKALLWFELGNIIRDSGNYQEAERAWTAAIQLEPKYAAAWSNLGVLQDINGDLDKAEHSFLQALALKSFSPSTTDKYEMEMLSLNWAIVHYNLGQLYEHQKRWAQAREQYQAVVRLEPQNQSALTRLAALKNKN